MLTRCRSCRSYVDTDAKVCPACGAPKPANVAREFLVIASVFFVGALLLFIVCNQIGTHNPSS